MRRGFIVAVTLLALHSRTALGQTFRVESLHASKSHPHLLLAPRASSTGTIRIQFAAGAFDDEAQQGLTHLAQQAMLCANLVEPYERFVIDLFAADASVSIETGVRESAFTLTASSKDFDGLAHRFATMILSPRISDERLEEAKSRTVSSRSSNATLLVTLLARAVISDPGFGNNPDGDKDQIRAMSADDVLTHIKKRLPPANATVIVTGGFNAQGMKAHLARFSGGAPTRRPRPGGDLAGTYHQKSYLEMHLVAYPIELKSPQSVAVAHMASTLLSEHIQREFRRLGIAYWASAFPIHREWLDGLIIALPIHSDRDLPVAAQLNHELDKVRTKLSDQEFDRNKAYLLEHLKQIDRDSSMLAEELAAGGGDLEWYGPRIVSAIKDMTKDQFTEKVSPWLDANASIHAEFSPRSAASAERRGRK
jgi:predicted Zn-dependent peptidase